MAAHYRRSAVHDPKQSVAAPSRLSAKNTEPDELMPTENSGSQRAVKCSHAPPGSRRQYTAGMPTGRFLKRRCTQSYWSGIAVSFLCPAIRTSATFVHLVRGLEPLCSPVRIPYCSDCFTPSGSFLFSGEGQVFHQIKLNDQWPQCLIRSCRALFRPPLGLGEGGMRGFGHLQRNGYAPRSRLA